jgi:hypothetical protein
MYLLSWSMNHYETGKTEYARLADIISDRSYTRKDLIKVANMLPGDTIKLDEGHYVTCLSSE